ncbi:Uncharacterised protein [Vibrio cholerae]|uniref:Uncharacterized protein n=1 Tax=Vibrio cholerae TaxID=666 RepID=A0A655PP86_VIBCL|nr:Uncharacterised protein [Vibrio cholerae]CSB38948.1 Uncharacterised protein [Vibrio cholerae]CSD24870.1 Uncharacterised protein [Vibrio cholerae]CSE00152.1 Uncharacterised protein [Vibrio cholerae]
MIWLDANSLLVKPIYRTAVVEPVDMVTVGSSASLGSCERTELVLARTSDNAALGSVFNFMVTVMVERPNTDCDVIKSMLSACATACSKG